MKLHWAVDHFDRHCLATITVHQMYMNEIDIYMSLIFLYAFHQCGIVIILAHECNWIRHSCPSLLWIYCKCSCLMLNFKFHIHCCFFLCIKYNVIGWFFVCLVVMFLICCHLETAMYQIFQVSLLNICRQPFYL